MRSSLESLNNVSTLIFVVCLLVSIWYGFGSSWHKSNRLMNIGTEVFLDSLSTLFNKDHSFMLSALQCLRLSRRVRDQTGAILSGRKIKVSRYRHDDIRYARICMNLHETLWSDTGITLRHDCSKGSTCYFVKTKKAQLTPIRFVIGEGTLSSSMPFTMIHHY